MLYEKIYLYHVIHDDFRLLLCRMFKTGEAWRKRECRLCSLQKRKSAERISGKKETMYYVIGYGKQTGSGYKIRVKKMTMDEGHVYIDTNLIGVPKRQQEKGYSYPYIVIKSQNYEKDVVFL